jgi:hypothetical protein
MTLASRSEVTVLPRAWTAGDQNASEKLWAMVFPELDRLARGYMRNKLRTIRCRRRW